MTKYQKTDIVLTKNFPFVTMAESKIPNIWYHEDVDQLFILTPRGFKVIKNSSKEYLRRNNFLSL